MKKSEYKSDYYVGICVVNTQGKVLLGKRTEDGIWTSPGGGSDPKETPVETAMRELFEESRIQCTKDELIELPTQVTQNGKPIFGFLLKFDRNIEDYVNVSSATDPDQEVPKWEWFDQNNLPSELKNDPNRLNTINNGLMKINGIIKSELLEVIEKARASIGEKRTHNDGSVWVKTPTGWQRAEKPKEDSEKEHKKSRGSMIGDISRLKGSVAEGKNYKIFLEGLSEQELAALHDKTLAENTKKQKDEEDSEEEKLSQKSQEELLQILKQTVKLGEEGKAWTKEEWERQFLNKSITQMGDQIGDPDINTAHHTIDKNGCDSGILSILENAMEGFSFGEASRKIPLNEETTLHLVKVDDGMYSGYVTRHKDEGFGTIDDNAKVRIEKQNLPALCSFLESKGWVQPTHELEESPEILELLDEAADTMVPEEEEPVLSEENVVLNKIRLLELITNIIN